MLRDFGLGAAAGIVVPVIALGLDPWFRIMRQWSKRSGRRLVRGAAGSHPFIPHSALMRDRLNSSPKPPLQLPTLISD